MPSKPAKRATYKKFQRSAPTSSPQTNGVVNDWNFIKPGNTIANNTTNNTNSSSFSMPNMSGMSGLSSTKKRKPGADTDQYGKPVFNATVIEQNPNSNANTLAPFVRNSNSNFTGGLDGILKQDVQNAEKVNALNHAEKLKAMQDYKSSMQAAGDRFLDPKTNGSQWFDKANQFRDAGAKNSATNQTNLANSLSAAQSGLKAGQALAGSQYQNGLNIMDSENKAAAARFEEGRLSSTNSFEAARLQNANRLNADAKEAGDRFEASKLAQQQKIDTQRSNLDTQRSNAVNKFEANKAAAQSKFDAGVADTLLSHTQASDALNTGLGKSRADLIGSQQVASNKYDAAQDRLTNQNENNLTRMQANKQETVAAGEKAISSYGDEADRMASAAAAGLNKQYQSQVDSSMYGSGATSGYGNDSELQAMLANSRSQNQQNQAQVVSNIYGQASQGRSAAMGAQANLLGQINQGQDAQRQNQAFQEAAFGADRSKAMSTDALNLSQIDNNSEQLKFGAADRKATAQGNFVTAGRSQDDQMNVAGSNLDMGFNQLDQSFNQMDQSFAEKSMSARLGFDSEVMFQRATQGASAMNARAQMDQGYITARAGMDQNQTATGMQARAGQANLTASMASTLSQFQTNAADMNYKAGESTNRWNELGMQLNQNRADFDLRLNSAFANHIHQMGNTVYAMTDQNPILAVGLFGAYKEISQLKLAESQANYQNDLQAAQYNLQVAQFNRDSGRG